MSKKMRDCPYINPLYRECFGLHHASCQMGGTQKADGSIEYICWMDEDNDEENDEEV